ncbi:MAG: cytochrome P460 family protein [Tenuifilaceae bacterium]
MNKLFYILLALLIISVIGCEKDEKASETDIELFEMAKLTSGFVWYKNSDALLPRSSISGHTEPYLRTRFNSTAASMLNDLGKVQSGISFPNGSLLVKELYSSTTNLSRYAILYKDTDNKYADSNGWVWGYINKDGTVVEPSSNKGNACKACHNQTGNIDYSLMNVAFP